MNTEQWRTIGVVVGAHGLQGSLRVESLSDFPERFDALRKVFLSRQSVLMGEFSIKNCRWLNRQLILTLSEIRDRSAAELLRGTEICVRLEESWPLPEDTYFISDLIGFSGIDERGEKIGVLVHVLDVSQHVLEFDLYNGENLLVPFVKEWVGRVDENARTIEILNWQRLTGAETVESADGKDDH